MTVKDIFENVLIELNKVQAPSLLLDDFIYLLNKSVQQYYNIRYNFFETKQQLTDDLRVLTKTIKIDGADLYLETSNNVFGTSYGCKLPSDYVHILNCICEFTDNQDKCGNTVVHQGANKLDTSQWSHIINNYYMRPSVKRPYYYIINVENPSKTLGASDQQKNSQVTSIRYGNSVEPIMQIKCGDLSRYTLNAVYIDYLRAPEYLTLDQDLLDDVTDTSAIVEFPDYVVYEIINQIVKLVLENNGNPRIQTNMAVNQSIA